MNEMDGPDEFEKALSRAMRRVDAPETMAKFLLSATETKRESVLPWRERTHKGGLYFSHARAWMGGAIAAALVLGILGGDRVHERHVREQQEAALVQRQFDTAIRVTDRALDRTQARLQRAGLKFGN